MLDCIYEKEWFFVGKAGLSLQLNQWFTKQLATDNLISKAGRKLIKQYSWLTLKKSLRRISNVKSGIEAIGPY